MTVPGMLHDRNCKAAQRAGACSCASVAMAEPENLLPESPADRLRMVRALRRSGLISRKAARLMLGITTAAVVTVLAGCLSTTKPSVVNDNPTTGGACHNGDQLGTLCKDGSCAPAGYRCAYDGHGVEIDEGQWGPGDVGTTYGAKRKDGGR